MQYAEDLTETETEGPMGIVILFLPECPKTTTLTGVL